MAGEREGAATRLARGSNVYVVCPHSGPMETSTMTTDTLSAAKMPAEHAEILALFAQRARSASVRGAGAALADAALAKGPLPRDELLASLASSRARRPKGLTRTRRDSSQQAC